MILVFVKDFLRYNLIKTFYRKLATLRIELDNITRKRRNVYHSHHASSEPTDLAKLRGIYVELAALRSYCDLNQTGFYKIIKKYDKIMEVRFIIFICISKDLIYRFIFVTICICRRKL